MSAAASLYRRLLAPQELEGVSLPPQVAGVARGAVRLAVPHALESAAAPRGLPPVSLVRARWWGEDRPGSLFRPALLSSGGSEGAPDSVSPRAVAMRYPVRVPADRLLEYFQDMKALRMDVINRVTRKTVGCCTLSLLVQHGAGLAGAGVGAEERLATLRRENALCEILSTTPGEEGVVLGYLAVDFDIEWTEDPDAIAADAVSEQAEPEPLTLLESPRNDGLVISDTPSSLQGRGDEIFSFPRRSFEDERQVNFQDELLEEEDAPEEPADSTSQSPSLENIQRLIDKGNALQNRMERAVRWIDPVEHGLSEDALMSSESAVGASWRAGSRADSPPSLLLHGVGGEAAATVDGRDSELTFARDLSRSDDVLQSEDHKSEAASSEGFDRPKAAHADSMELTFETMELEPALIDQLRQLRDPTSATSRFSPVKITVTHTKVSSLFAAHDSDGVESLPRESESTAFDVTTSLRKHQWRLHCSKVTPVEIYADQDNTFDWHNARHTDGKRLLFRVVCENESDADRQARRRERGLFSLPTKSIELNGSVDARELLDRVLRSDAWVTEIKLFLSEDTATDSLATQSRSRGAKKKKRRKAPQHPLGQLRVRFRLFAATQRYQGSANPPEDASEILQNAESSDSNAFELSVAASSEASSTAVSPHAGARAATKTPSAWPVHESTRRAAAARTPPASPQYERPFLSPAGGADPGMKHHDQLQFAVVIAKAVVTSISASKAEENSTPFLTIQYSVPYHLSTRLSVVRQGEAIKRRAKRKLMLLGGSAQATWVADFAGHSNVIPSRFHADAANYFDRGVLILEVWRGTSKEDHVALLGIAKLSTREFGAFMRDTDLGAFCSQSTPFVSAESTHSIENPFTGKSTGLVRLWTCVGTAEQIVMWTSTLTAIIALQAVVRGFLCRLRYRTRLQHRRSRAQGTHLDTGPADLAHVTTSTIAATPSSVGQEAGAGSTAGGEPSVPTSWVATGEAYPEPQGSRVSPPEAVTTPDSQLQLVPAEIALAVRVLDVSDLKNALAARVHLDNSPSDATSLAAEHLRNVLIKNAQAMQVIFDILLGPDREPSDGESVTTTPARRWRTPSVLVPASEGRHALLSGDGSGEGDKLGAQVLLRILPHQISGLKHGDLEIKLLVICAECDTLHEVGTAKIPTAPVLFRPNGLQGSFPLRVGRVFAGTLGVHCLVHHNGVGEAPMPVEAAPTLELHAHTIAKTDTVTDSLTPPSPDGTDAFDPKPLPSEIEVAIAEVRNVLVLESEDPGDDDTPLGAFVSWRVVSGASNGTASPTYHPVTRTHVTRLTSTAEWHVSRSLRVNAAVWPSPVLEVSLWQQSRWESLQQLASPTGAVIGKARVDLSLLGHRWAVVDGWYHVLDARGINRGQIKVRVNLPGGAAEEARGMEELDMELQSTSEGDTSFDTAMKEIHDAATEVQRRLVGRETPLLLRNEVDEPVHDEAPDETNLHGEDEGDASDAGLEESIVELDCDWSTGEPGEDEDGASSHSEMSSQEFSPLGQSDDSLMRSDGDGVGDTGDLELASTGVDVPGVEVPQADAHEFDERDGGDDGSVDHKVTASALLETVDVAVQVDLEAVPPRVRLEGAAGDGTDGGPASVHGELLPETASTPEAHPPPVSHDLVVDPDHGRDSGSQISESESGTEVDPASDEADAELSTDTVDDQAHTELLSDPPIESTARRSSSIPIQSARANPDDKLDLIVGLLNEILAVCMQTAQAGAAAKAQPTSQVTDDSAPSYDSSTPSTVMCDAQTQVDEDLHVDVTSLASAPPQPLNLVEDDSAPSEVCSTCSNAKCDAQTQVEDDLSIANIVLGAQSALQTDHTGAPSDGSSTPSTVMCDAQTQVDEDLSIDITNLGTAPPHLADGASQQPGVEMAEPPTKVDLEYESGISASSASPSFSSTSSSGEGFHITRAPPSTTESTERRRDPGVVAAGEERARLRSSMLSSPPLHPETRLPLALRVDSRSSTTATVDRLARELSSLYDRKALAPVSTTFPSQRSSPLAEKPRLRFPMQKRAPLQFPHDSETERIARIMQGSLTYWVKESEAGSGDSIGESDDSDSDYLF